MHPLVRIIKIILQKYMLEPHAPIMASTALSDLAIDCLDLPMIFLDIEDAFDVQLSISDETDQTLTAGGLVALVAAGLAAKKERSMRPAMPRPRRNWMSTGADH